MKSPHAKNVELQLATKRKHEARLACHAEEFQEAVSKIEDAYREGLRAFCAWVTEAWEFGDEASWGAEEPYPGEDYRKGWNDALTSLDGALALFLEEYGA